MLTIGALAVARPVPLTVQRTLHPERTTVGSTAVGIVVVVNDSRRPARPQFAEDRIGDRVIRIALPAIAPQDHFEQPYNVVGRDRGLVQVGPIRLVRTDPLRLFRVEQTQGSTMNLWVQPRVHRLVSATTGWSQERDGATSDSAPRGSAAFHALREYQRGDDLRHIHWRTSARANRLMVRHYVDTQITNELLVLDTRGSSYPSNLFEDAVEICASISAAIEASGGECSIEIGGQADSPYIHEGSSVMDRLTVATTSGHSVAADVFRGVGRALGATGVVVVTGSVDANEMVGCTRMAAPGRPAIVICCRSGVESSSMSVIGNVIVIDTPSAKALAGIWGEAVLRS